jgi:cytidylate kinase
MSIVAISSTVGSLGDEMGREVAQRLSYAFANREIILQAAQEFGEAVAELEHVTEEKPDLWERFTESKRRYATYVEAVVWGMADRGDVVLVGRGAPYLLRQVRHALRVRVTAPEALRARRVEGAHGFTPEAARDLVHQSDRERAARVRFLYHVDWDDPLLYDLAVNSERLDVAGGARLICESLADERFRPTPESRAAARDLSISAHARAALLADPGTRALDVRVACLDGRVSLTGHLDREEQRKAVEQVVRAIPGAGEVRNEITIMSRRGAPLGV